MIFVTVGTHEQSFDRLIRCIDEMVGKDIIKEKVVMQVGYCKYIPKNCEYSKLYSYDEMNLFAQKSKIIVTHGGPGSIFLAQQYGKMPIVMPRQKKYNEHVDNHQVIFSKKMAQMNKIVLALEESDLSEKLIKELNKETENSIYENNNDEFVRKFKELINQWDFM